MFLEAANRPDHLFNAPLSLGPFGWIAVFQLQIFRHAGAVEMFDEGIYILAKNKG